MRGVGAKAGDAEVSAFDGRRLKGGEEADRMKRALAALVIAAGITAGTVGPAFGNPPPPTNGGNGAGHSGQCTGNPDDRPASCH
jgi:hypothetical protein